MVWHGMFRVVPFAFSVEKSTPDGKKYASGAGALVTNHSYVWSLVDDKLLNIVLRLKLNVERKVKVKANAENWFVRKFFVA